MKHASPETVARLNPQIERLRALVGLTERKPGTFYRKSSAFLHFHEDPAGLFADLKVDGGWMRFPANTGADWDTLVQRAAQAL